MSDAAKQLVLLVEDDPDQSNALLTALSAGGYAVAATASARDAMFKLKNQKFHCVILDLLLEGENGTEVVNFMRTRPDTPNRDTPILIMSANLNPEAMKALTGKIQGAMVKPFEPSALVERVNRILATTNK